MINYIEIVDPNLYANLTSRATILVYNGCHLSVTCQSWDQDQDRGKAHK